AAEKAKLNFDEATLPQELSLEQQVLNATKAKLSSSSLAQADRLKRAVLSAESAEKSYTASGTGEDAIHKQQLMQAVNTARQAYAEYVLNQAPVKAGLSNASS